MSAIEYRGLLFEVSQRFDERNVLKKLLFLCKKKLTSGGNIENALALFERLEEQKYLGTDRLKLLKELLEEVGEWSLLEKVKTFENKRKEYKALLKKARCALDELNDLERLIKICEGKISEEREGNIKDVQSLLQGLEDEEILGISCLDILKDLLTATERGDLLQEVEKFEERRNREAKFKRQKGRAAACVTSIADWIKAPCVGGVSFVVEKLKRAITLVCNFRTAAGVLLVVNSAMALRKCKSLKDFQETFEKVILPSFNKLIESSNGSVRFTVESENLIALKELWDIYKDGTLQSRLQEFLVTDEIKQLANGEDIEVTVFIDEHEYNEAYFNLFLLHQAPNVEEEERPGRRTRRNSDSFLCVKPNENEIGLMKLMEETEDKWGEEKKMLELRIVELEETLKAERTRDLDQYEILERPRKRRRRNSDSNLYYKAREEEVEQTENQPERASEGEAQLDFEKRMFVENYLQNIHETHSMTTETGDSGIRTHGVTSEIEMQDITGGDHNLCWKDLSEEVIRELERRLKDDQTALRQICESFGMDILLFYSPTRKFREIFSMFPDTPVKLLKEVFEALQLYDLIDLLEEGKPRATISLRPALRLQEIEKLRNPDDLPISYHSSAAVLIIDGMETCDTEGIEKFFKDFNSKSEVTVVRCRNLGGRAHFFQHFPMLPSKDVERELNKLGSTSSEVIQSWKSNEDKFSLFAVIFNLPWRLYQDQLAEMVVFPVKERLVTLFPTKVKLIIRPFSEEPRTGLHENLVDVCTRCEDGGFLTSMLKIFTRRWQTMDLISMMRELKRSLREEKVKVMRGRRYVLYGSEDITVIARIEENLSCIVRLKMREEPTY